MRGRKTGGRQRGTPNKRSSLVESMLEKMQADPIGHMARVMMDEDADRRLRFDAAKELAQYIAPKRRAIEVQEFTEPQQVVFEVVYVGADGKPTNHGAAKGSS